MDDVHALNEVKTSFQPLEGNLPMYLTIWTGFAPSYIPCADQLIEALERGIRCERLLCNLGIGIIYHSDFSFTFCVLAGAGLS